MKELSKEKISSVAKHFSDINRRLLDFNRFKCAVCTKLGREWMTQLLFAYKTMICPGVCEIPEGEIIYRARIFEKRLSEEKINDRIYKVDVSLAPFYGYGNRDSGAPPAKFHTKGNCFSDANTIFLYCSSAKKTALLESFKGATGLMSVAAVKALKRLNLLYLPSMVSPCCSKEDVVCAWLARFFFEIAQFFRTSDNSPECQKNIYQICQSVASSAKKLGFDGVAYLSAKTQYGEEKLRMNYAFFKPKDCNVVSSELLRVEEVSCKTTPLF